MMLAAVALLLSLQVAPKPEEIGVFYHVDEGKLVALERQTAVSEARWRWLGFGGYRALAWIKGERAALRLGPRPQFVLRAPDPTKYQLLRYTPRKGRREVVLQSGGRIAPAAVTCRVTEIAPGVYQFVPAEDLSPGEYGFSPTDSNDSFNFGVDSAHAPKLGGQE